MTQRRTSPVASVALLLCGISMAAALAPYPLGLHAAASLLEVTLPTPKATVKAAYRRKARISHPDVSKRADAASYFVQLTAAYETLLQFSVTMPASAPPRGTTHTQTTTTTTNASPPPRPPSSQWQQRPPSYAERSRPRDPVRFEQQVSAWRDFWQASLQATQLQTEADRKSVQAAVLAAERQRLSAQLNELLKEGGGAGVDACRARYAQASAKHSDAECAARTLAARAAMLRTQASEHQDRAQGGGGGGRAAADEFSP